MKAVGIVALLLSLLSLNIPLFLGAFVSTWSGVFAIYSCRNPNNFALAALLINIINILIMSQKKIEQGVDLFAYLGPLVYFFLGVLIVQVIGIAVYVRIINSSKRI